MRALALASAVILSGCASNADLRRETAERKAFEASIGSRRWFDSDAMGQAQQRIFALEETAERVGSNRFSAASFRAAQAVCADQCEAVGARVGRNGEFYCHDFYGNEWQSGGECD